MSIVVISQKGQITIPREIRRRMKIKKGDPLLLEMDPDGGLHLKPAAVFPLESYSSERLQEFAVEDAMPEAEQKRLRKTLNG